MRAAFFTKHDGFEIREVSPPTPGPDEVMVDVDACGVCGSDLHFFTGAPGVTGVPGTRDLRSSFVLGLEQDGAGTSRGRGADQRLRHVRAVDLVSSTYAPI